MNENDCLSGMADQQRWVCFILSSGYCQRFLLLQSLDTLCAGFKPVKNLKFEVEWRSAAVITATPKYHLHFSRIVNFSLLSLPLKKKLDTKICLNHPKQFDLKFRIYKIRRSHTVSSMYFNMSLSFS